MARSKDPKQLGWRPWAQSSLYIDLIRRASKFENGRFKGLHLLTYRQLVTDIEFALSFPDTIVRGDRYEIVRAGLMDAAPLQPNLDRNALLSKINGRFTAYMARPIEPYHLVSTVSIPTGLNIRHRTVNGCRIAFPSDLAQYDRSELRPPFVPELSAHEHAYRPIVVRTTGRTPNEAAYKAMDSVDYLRAVWNLHLNGANYTFSFGGSVKPVNLIRLGRLHSLHHPDGPLAYRYWLVAHQYEPAEPRDFDQLRQLLPDVLGRVERSSRDFIRRAGALQEMIQTALLCCVRALDEPLLGASIHGLWSTLEVLTGYPDHGTHNDVVSRAAFEWMDRTHMFRVLQKVRDLRNEIAHHRPMAINDHAEYQEAMRHQLMNATHAMFRAALALGFRDASSLYEYLDLPSDPDRLRRLNESVSMALEADRSRRKWTKSQG